MNLAHVRCKSPEMVGKELWTTMLAYNWAFAIQGFKIS